MPFSDVYPHYVKKIERKGRSVEELHIVISWLTGFSEKKIQTLINKKSTFQEFFKLAKLNPKAKMITGTICGVKIQEIEEPLMKKIRYLDKVVDELAQGKSLDKILRS